MAPGLLSRDAGPRLLLWPLLGLQAHAPGADTVRAPIYTIPWFHILNKATVLYASNIHQNDMNNHFGVCITLKGAATADKLAREAPVPIVLGCRAQDNSRVRMLHAPSVRILVPKAITGISCHGLWCPCAQIWSITDGE